MKLGDSNTDCLLEPATIWRRCSTRQSRRVIILTTKRVSMIIKVELLSKCSYCGGKAYFPAEETVVDTKGECYKGYLPPYHMLRPSDEFAKHTVRGARLACPGRGNAQTTDLK